MLRTSIRVLPLRARRAKRRRRPRHDVPGAHMETVTQKGRFGKYGGRYVPETLIPALDELEQQYDRCRQDHLFQEELAYYLRRYCGRPTPLYFAERLTERLGGARVYLKREDLLHTGAHKINNTMGQVLLAHRVVDLVRARVQEVFPFEIDARAAEPLCQPLRKVEGGGPPAIAAQVVGQLFLEQVILPAAIVLLLELIQCRNQRLRDVPAAVLPEAAFLGYGLHVCTWYVMARPSASLRPSGSQWQHAGTGSQHPTLSRA